MTTTKDLRSAILAGEDAQASQILSEPKLSQDKIIPELFALFGEIHEKHRVWAQKIALHVADRSEPKDETIRWEWLKAINNACLISIGDGPKDVRLALAELGIKFGADNVDIFHNAACTFCSLGKPEQALEAVQLASLYAYDALHSMQNDTDLDLIRNEEAFAQAIQKGQTLRTPESIALAWKSWSNKHGVHPCDIFASNDHSVHFWFSNSNPEANEHFQQFASDGEGGLFTFWKKDQNKPIVHLSSDGEAKVVATDMLSFLSLTALCGDNLLDVITNDGTEYSPEVEMNEWLQTHFNQAPIDEANTVLEQANAEHPGLEPLIAQLS